MEEVPDASLGGNEPDNSSKLRSYQQEMLEESLKHNVIVAMDTGSGKTHVAVARMRAELERLESADKLIWFLAPSVALSEQHYTKVVQLLPAYQIKLLVGSDKLDKWTDQWHWDAILANVEIVVGTPKVLEEALEHGFVSMKMLSLLVFDEAHHCVGDHPMAGIMRDFYHSNRVKREHNPGILGLTASPVYGASVESLSLIEAVLNSRVITPKRHRSELSGYVHPPELVRVAFEQSMDEPLGPISRLVEQAFATYDLRADPYVVELLESLNTSDELSKVMTKRKTYCNEQLRILGSRARTLTSQLGSTMAEQYTDNCIRRFLESVDCQPSAIPEMTDKEKIHLTSIFNSINQSVKPPTVQSIPSYRLSTKADKLIKLLGASSSPDFNGIIFVEQRAVAIALADLLSKLPQFHNKYNVGVFLGTSTSVKRKSSIADMSDLKRQQADLDGFRQGTKNLMIATNILEEGIDISACNTVVSYDLPKNLVSFVQRRGRARQRDSKYIIFLPETDTRANHAKWQVLEERMKEAYEDEKRQVAPAYEQTDDDKATDEALLGRLVHRVERTGALLTAKNAKAHLFHFCSTGLQAAKYTDLRPELKPCRDDLTNLFTAEVTLPVYVHASVRTARSRNAWRTERGAILDAAFHAYLQLYNEGLINDNLLPLLKNYVPSMGEHRDQPKLVQVAERRSSWINLATKATTVDWQACSVHLHFNGTTIASLAMWMPCKMLSIAPVSLYWNESTVYQVSFESSNCSISAASSKRLRALTGFLLQPVHGTRMASKDNFVVLLAPISTTCDGATEQNGVTSPASEAWTDTKSPAAGRRLVSVPGQAGAAFISEYVKKPGVEATLDAKNILPEAAYGDVVVRKFPKRKDFLHPVAHGESAAGAYSRLQSFREKDCVVSPLPLNYAILAAFVPSLLHRLDVTLLIEDLCSTILRPVGFVEESLVLEAISSPQANEEGDYNRLEYLGDHILKFCTSLQVMAQHFMWPEAYLSAEKDRIVRNSNLAKAAVEVGLDAYILTKPFTGAKWRPVYIDEVLASDHKKQREMSSKVLADVVEALIGAAYVDGGLPKAYQCIKTLLPRETWSDHTESLGSLKADPTRSSSVNLPKLEELIGHKFNQPSLLLEAVTHASSQGAASSMSYERLEFLGDAVLDLIITPKLFAHPRKLRHWQLHHVHEALVNSHILGYCCMNYSLESETYDVVPKSTTFGNEDMQTERSIRRIHLHDFLHCDHQLLPHKQASLAAYAQHHTAIATALASGPEYPWLDLIALSPRKFFSDLVEAVLGALYIDTAGDLRSCEAFVEKLGLLQLTNLFLEEDVQTTHPKEMLGVLADRGAVVYKSEIVTAGQGEVKCWQCSVSVGGENVATVGGCGSMQEAEARAASEAGEVLRARMRDSGTTRMRSLKGGVMTRIGEDAATGAQESDGTDQDEAMGDT
ncbi:hypothetical protein MBLNU230_g8369t1 [Neophaeotheca triangularis]